MDVKLKTACFVRWVCSCACKAKSLLLSQPFVTAFFAGEVALAMVESAFHVKSGQNYCHFFGGKELVWSTADSTKLLE